MQRRLAIVAAAACCAVSAGFANAQQQELVVRIGTVAPLTGPQAHYGKDNERGAALAIDDLNKKNLTIGGRKVRWELVSEDDAADPRQATTVAQKLVDMKINGVVGHMNSGTTLPASKIYADAGIPMVTPSATNPKITQQGFKNVFRTIGNDAAIGAGIAKYLYQNGLRKVAIIDDRTAYGQGVADEFEKAFKASGGSVVQRQYTNDKATEFSSILTAIKAKAPDLVFFGGMDTQGGPMYRQLRQLGIDSRFAGGDGICTLDMNKISTNGPDRTLFCGEAGVSLSKMKGGAEFEKRFKARFSGAEIVLYAPYTYDAVSVLADAMVRAQSSDPEKYMPALAKADYEGVTAHIRFDAKGDLQDAAVSLQTFEKGQRIPVAVVH